MRMSSCKKRTSSYGAGGWLVVKLISSPTECLRVQCRSRLTSGCSSCVLQVYLGLNETTGELMAVKQIKVSAGDEKAMHIAALEREIVLYRKMRHRHIVGYIDMERGGGGRLHLHLPGVRLWWLHSQVRWEG